MIEGNVFSFSFFIKKVKMANIVHVGNKLLALHQHLYSSKEFADVTLVSEDYVTFEAHKTILAYASAELKKLLCLSVEQKPILFLKGVSGYEIENLLRFLYLGENWLDISKFHYLGLLEDTNETIELLHNDNHKNQAQNLKHEKVHKLDFLFQSKDEPSEPSKELDNDNKVTIDFLQVGEDTIDDNTDTTDTSNSDALTTQESNNQIQSDNLIESDGDKEQDFDGTASEPVNVQVKEVGQNDTYKRKKEEPAECDICAIKFTTKRSLQRHIKIIHELHMEKCPHCGREFKGKDSLKYHIKAFHAEKTTYNCDKCEYKAVRKESVKNHRLKVHIYTCTFCQITYTEEEDFRVHIKEQHVKKFC